MPGQYNPESILQEQFESQRQQIQKHFQTQWDEVNNRARAGLYKSQKDRDGDFFGIRAEATQALDEFDQKSGQATEQLKQIDKLAEMGAIKNPDEVKWRMVLGPEAERGMFPKQVDPREEHRKILAEQTRLLGVVKSFAMGRDGKLYQAKEKKDGNTWYYTDQPDRGKPASQQESQLWVSSAQALGVLDQAELTITQQMADAGIENPNRLQSLLVSSEKEHWAKRATKAAAKGYYATTGIGLMHRSIKGIQKTFATEPSGTFAQKVKQTLPQRRQSQRKVSRQKLLSEYRRLGGSNTSEGRAFADKNLR